MTLTFTEALIQIKQINGDLKMTETTEVNELESNGGINLI